MPRQGQIIPSYLVPHVATYINDNSTFTDEAAVAAETGIRSIHVFASPKGEDGVLKSFTNTTDFINEYGTPNFALYGQPQYNAYAALASGNARCWCMRVASPKATYAHIVILAKVKTVENEIAVGEGESATTKKVKKVEVKFTSTIADNAITDKQSLAVDLEAFTNNIADEDGYTTYPIFAIASTGRGVYGNNIRVRIVPDTYSDKDNEFRNYIVEVRDIDNGRKKDMYYCAFNPDAIIGSKSLYIADVINDAENDLAKIEVEVAAESLNSIYEMYKDTFKDAEGKIPKDADIVSFAEFDFIKGLTKSGAEIEGYSIISNEDFAFDVLGGFALEGGTDGTFAADYVPTEVQIAAGEPTREQAINDEYLKAFSGEIDKSILSKRRAPAELIMDAGYDKEIKDAIVALALKRYDARCIIDAGLLNSTTYAQAWAESMKTYDDRIISKECQHYKTKDPFTGKVIDVTITYFLSGALPTHYTVVGNQVPFVGEDYATLTGYIKNSLKPVIDADDFDVKESLYTNRVNFFECIAENTFIRGVQGTSQTVWSDLSEENNVAVMLEMKRMLEESVSKKLYNFAEPEDRIRFTESADRMFADFRGRKLRNFRVYFDMNAFEEERSILHCYLEIVFKTMAKRGIVEIDINKRV